MLLFASAREMAGARSLGRPCAGQTVAQLREQLGSDLGPGFARLLTTCATWVNGEPAAPGTVLQSGDEVAVLPPVSGG